jgi:protein-S-isoprenylcysteine O-methyltransferase Ste14
VKRLVVFGYGAVAYLLFFVAILYAIGFVGNFGVPKSIDRGGGQPEAPALIAILVNSGLLGIFAIQHTIMARKPFKRRLTQFIPASAERSTFVFASSAILLGTFAMWMPMPEIVWQVENEAARMALTGTYFLGWFLVFFSSFLINHFDLFGLRQVYLELRQQPYRPLVFRTASLYRFVRHPLLLGFLIAFWSAPVMTQGRLLFAILTTAYIFVGIQFEERDLAAEHGESYRKYQRTVPMVIPYMPPASAEGSPSRDRATTEFHL